MNMDQMDIIEKDNGLKVIVIHLKKYFITKTKY